MRARRSLVLLRALTGLCFLMVLFTISCSNPSSSRAPGTMVLFDRETIGKRPMIIAPHPDDEALATAGLISLSLQNGSEPVVVVVTTGDASTKACRKIAGGNNVSATTHREVGKLRCLESLSAMRSIGVHRKRIVFLGFADGSTNSLLDENWDREKPHTGLNGCVRSPYRFSYFPGVLYCGENLKRCIEALIEKYQPTSIFYPHPQDDNHDHWALNAFVQYALTDMRFETREFTYLVHRRAFPWPKGYFHHHGIFPPPQLVREKGVWLVLPLCPVTVKLKNSCISLYTIPLSIIRELMLSFVRRNELYFSPEIQTLRVAGSARSGPRGNENERVFIDPENDTENFHAREADIEGLSLRCDREKLRLSLLFAVKPSSDYTYGFRMRIFKGAGPFRVERVDAFLSRDGVTTKKLAGNSLTIKPGLEEPTWENRVSITFSAGILKDAYALLVSADVFKDGIRTDKCGSARVRLEK